MTSSGYLLLTGANGFVGSATLRLLARGSTPHPWSSLKAVVRSDAAAEQVKALGVEPVRGDLLTPSPELLQAISEARYVLHCADAPRTPRYAEDRVRLDKNLLGALDPRRVARAVYVCGSSYFGVSEGAALIDETTPPRPIGVGPIFEPSLQALREATHQGLDAVAAFVSGVYGPGSWFTQRALQALEHGQPLPVLEPPPIWPYIHIDDCARALEFLLTVDTEQLNALGRDVILADDTPVPMTTFIEELARATGRSAHLERLERSALQARLSPMEFNYWSANMPHSNARLRRLGFTCRYPSVREGVQALGLSPR